MLQVFSVISYETGNANHPDQERAFSADGHNYGQDSERVGSDSEAAKQNSIKRSDLLCASINPIATMESLWKLLSGKQIIDQRVSTHSAMKCDSNGSDEEHANGFKTCDSNDDQPLGPSLTLRIGEATTDQPKELALVFQNREKGTTILCDKKNDEESGAFHVGIDNCVGKYENFLNNITSPQDNSGDTQSTFDDTESISSASEKNDDVIISKKTKPFVKLVARCCPWWSYLWL